MSSLVLLQTLGCSHCYWWVWPWPRWAPRSASPHGCSATRSAVCHATSRMQPLGRAPGGRGGSSSPSGKCFHLEQNAFEIDLEDRLNQYQISLISFTKIWVFVSLVTILDKMMICFLVKWHCISAMHMCHCLRLHTVVHIVCVWADMQFHVVL